jgi:hypothetical protein
VTVLAAFSVAEPVIEIFYGGKALDFFIFFHPFLAGWPFLA